jgi:translation elongation factor EF-Tu-like GTPase
MSDRPQIECELVFLASEEGGRSTAVNLSDNRYRPHLKTEDSDWLGVMFSGGPASVAPGESATAIALLIFADVDYSPLRQPGTAFSILEGPKVVGHGVVRHWVS